MIEIFTDGACNPNPGQGGWSFVAYENGVEIHNASGSVNDTTNNVMEMTGVLNALVWARLVIQENANVLIKSDSAYVVKGCNIWRHRWAKNNWRGKINLKNADLWKAIAAAHDAFPCKITWVKGHAGIAGNERADDLADSAMVAFDHKNLDTTVSGYNSKLDDQFRAIFGSEEPQ